jgi:hypothetical protein
MYAYDFKPKNNGINHREIFVVMPFSPKYDVLYNDMIQPATAKANEILIYNKAQLLYTYRTKDDIRTVSGWINVLEHLKRAQIVLGVLTGNNINVFYELGIAHATQQISRQILIARKGYKPSFDTKDIIYFPYDSKDLTASIAGLAHKIADAIKTYNIDHDKEVSQARQLLGPYDFEVLMAHGVRRNFAVQTSRNFELEYDREYGEGSLRRHVEGITNLCRYRLLALNTAPRRLDGVGTNIEFSYYWTTLGNDLLYSQKIINEETLMKRRSLPDSISE